jgi:hypothetical protein
MRSNRADISKRIPNPNFSIREGWRLVKQLKSRGLHYGYKLVPVNTYEGGNHKFIVEVSGQLHAQTALIPREEPPAPIV